MMGLSNEEYKRRDKLIEKIEGFYGADDGFAELKTETLKDLSDWIRLIRRQMNQEDAIAKAQEALEKAEVDLGIGA